jgi:hypothetical protein
MTAVKAIRPLDPNALSASPEEAARYLSVHRRKIMISACPVMRLIYPHETLFPMSPNHKTPWSFREICTGARHADNLMIEQDAAPRIRVMDFSEAPAISETIFDRSLMRPAASIIPGLSRPIAP